MNKEQKKKLYKMGLPIIMGTILLLGVSYAWLTLTLNGTKTNVLKAGTLSLTLTDTATNGINMEGSVPMLDEVGVTTSPYSFTLTNNGTVESEYTIYLDDVALDTGETKLPDTVIKYNLVKDNISYATGLLSTIGSNPNRVVDSGKIAPNTTYNYDLRIWLDKTMTTSDMGKVFKGKIRIVAEQVKALAESPEECFEFDSSTGTITGYKCYGVNNYGLTPIADVVIPKTINGVTVTTIGDNAFGAHQLTDDDRPTSITIPSTVTKIGGAAFYATGLDKVNLSEGLLEIGNGAFVMTNIAFVEIPSTVQKIEGTAFSTGYLKRAIIKGKSSPADFTGGYGDEFESPFEGLDSSNIIWQP